MKRFSFFQAYNSSPYFLGPGFVSVSSPTRVSGSLDTKAAVSQTHPLVRIGLLLTIGLFTLAQLFVVSMLGLLTVSLFRVMWNSGENIDPKYLGYVVIPATMAVLVLVWAVRWFAPLHFLVRTFTNHEQH